MDPLSVLTGVIGIVLGAAHVARRLSDLHGSYVDAPRSVQFLIDECFAISGALSQLQGWICREDQATASNRRFIHIDMLVNTVNATRRTFNELQAETERFEGLCIKGKGVMGIRYLWKEESIKETLGRLQSHKTGLTLILTVLQSQSNTETQDTLKEMMAFMVSMSQSQQQMWKALKKADILSADDGRSLFTAADSVRPRIDASDSGNGLVDEMKRFAFDEELKNTTVYRGISNSDDVLTMADISDISSLALPDHNDDIGGCHFKEQIIGENIKDEYVVLDNSETGPSSTDLDNNDSPLAYVRSPPLADAYPLPLPTATPISKKTVLSWLGPPKVDEWDAFWNVPASRERRGDPQRQRVIHKFLCDEIEYFRDLYLFRESYTSTWTPYGRVLGAQTSAKVFNSTIQPVIDRFLILAELEERLLLRMLQQAAEEGPYVGDLTKIHSEWIKDAEAAYVEYCSAQAGIEYRISAAAEKYLSFQQYLTASQHDAVSRRLGLSEFVLRPVTRIVRQHYHWHSVALHTTDAEQVQRETELKAELHDVGTRMNRALGEGRYKLFREILKSAPKELPESDLIHLRSELRTMNWKGEGVLISGMFILCRTDRGECYCELAMDINDPTFSVARDTCLLNFSSKSFLRSSGASATTLWEGPKPVSVIGDKRVQQARTTSSLTPSEGTSSLLRRASVGSPPMKQSCYGFEVRYQGETYQFGVTTSRADTRDRWMKELRVWSGQDIPDVQQKDNTT